MKEFDRPIGRAWRRLRIQRFLAIWVVFIAVGLLLAAGALAVDRLSSLELPGPWWAAVAIGAGAATAFAALLAVVTGPSRVEAALAIDRKFGLDERLSTALTLPESLRETPAGRALVADAVRHVSQLDIRSHFGLSFPKRLWLPAIPAAFALLFAYLPEGLLQSALASGNKAAESKRVDPQTARKVLASVGKKLQERKEALAKAELGETQTGKLMAEILKKVNDLSKAPPADRRQAMADLNKLAEFLKERRRELEDGDQIRKQLEQLKDLGRNGPADEIARELARGDFAKAAEKMQELREKMAKGEMSPQEKQELQEQLKTLQKRIEQVANQEERRKELEEARAKGQISEQTYQEQKQKLDQQAESMKGLKQLAEKLSQAQEQMASGDMKKAAETLGEGQEQLERMAQNGEELEALESALADLQDAKEGMAEDSLNRLGEALEGMQGLGQNGMRPGNGNGMGRGRGQGDRGEAPDDTNAYETRVRQQITKGVAVLGGFADPTKQVRGESLAEIQGSVEAAAGAAAQALTEQKIPNESKRHVLDYYDKLRTGE